MGLPDVLVLAIGAGAAWLMWRLVHPRARLVIGDRGILDRSSGLGWIHWDEIEGAYRTRSDRDESVLLRVRCSERLARRLQARRSVGCTSSFEVPLALEGTSVSGVEVLQQILSRCRA